MALVSVQEEPQAAGGGILQLAHVRKVFKNGNKGPEHVVLDDVSFTVKDKEFISLLGPSGCGKTTLLTIIAGFQKASGGVITLNGRPVNGPGVDRGFVFQGYALFPWMTVEQNILYAQNVRRASEREKRECLRRLLEMSHLAGSEHKYPRDLSGGMRQRVAVMRALAAEPRVLLLDEPLSAIDYQMRHLMQEELSRLLEGAATTVVMVTHDVDEAVYMSDRVIVMTPDRGRIIADYKIDLPRPRERKSASFMEHQEQLSQYLMEAFGAGKPADF